MKGFLFIGLIFISFSFLSFNAPFKYRFRWCFGFGVFLLCISISSFTKSQKQPSIPEGNYQLSLIQVGEINLKKNSKVATAMILQAHDSLINIQSKPIHLIVYFPLDCPDSILQIGNTYIVNGFIRSIKNNGNPHEFDYKQYMLHKNIAYSFFVDTLKQFPSSKSFNLISKATYFRLKLLNRLRKIIPNKDAFALASAISLGYKEELTNDIRESFSQSGTAHLLAVSGLHTGIIFAILLIVLFPLRLIGLNRLSYLLCILFLVIYAFITGLSPSVIRAVSMISIYLSGKIIWEKSNGLNALFITAFLMLLYEPQMLYDVGFQLSFSAVLSILLFYPFFQKKINTLPKINKFILSIVAVTFSAQLFVLPLSIYYFHTFPLWTIPANLLLIPLQTPYIASIFIGILIEPLPFLANTFRVFLTNYSLVILKINEFFSSLPGNINLYPTLALIVLIEFMLWSIYKFISKRNAKNIIQLEIACILLMVGILYDNFSHQKQDEIVLFNQTKQNNIHIFQNQHQTILTSDTVLDYKGIEYAINPYTNYLHVKQTDIIQNDTNIPRKNLYFQAPFIQIKNVKMALLTNNRFKYLNSAYHIPELDYLIIGGKFRGHIAELTHLFSFERLIMLPTLPLYIQNRLSLEADSLCIERHSIREEGAYQIALK